jgi:CubicO group peptidase (beta-lactamase class C family)
MRLKIVAPILLLAFWTAGSVRSAPEQSRTGENVAPQASYAPVTEALSKFIQHEMQDKQLPAFSIALVDNQQIVWAHEKEMVYQ